MAKVRQALDQFVSLVALALLSPVLAIIAAAVFLEMGRPILFKQVRVGLKGDRFELLKFRTMRAAKGGASLTVSGDSRITRVGGVLRKFKLDELPQLWNVVRGEMRLVGPRPELPQFVDLGNPVWSSVLQVPPGITDPASIAYRNENDLLASVSNPIEFYEKTVLPAKLALNLEYLKKQSLWLDMRVLLRTAHCALFPSPQDTQGIKETGN
jgi:lipopolysaccharide/colanic/teichoic acid biosynthesis glycosyltransferase